MFAMLSYVFPASFVVPVVARRDAVLKHVCLLCRLSKTGIANCCPSKPETFVCSKAMIGWPVTTSLYYDSNAETERPLRPSRSDQPLTRATYRGILSRLFWGK